MQADAQELVVQRCETMMTNSVAQPAVVFRSSSPDLPSYWTVGPCLRETGPDQQRRLVFATATVTYSTLTLSSLAYPFAFVLYEGYLSAGMSLAPNYGSFVYESYGELAQLRC